MLGGDGGGKAGEGGWENGAGPLRVRPLFLPARRGFVFRLPSWGHSPAVGGCAALRMGRTPASKTAFSFAPQKKKVVLDSEKEKVDQWK